MLTRIVKMTFAPEHVSDFLKVFEEKKKLIASFEGCSSVQLLRDMDSPNVFFTYSQWDKSESLEKYRSSGLFIETWDTVKNFFIAKPEAWSVQLV